MRVHARTRVLLGLAAGATATALLGSSLAVPADAAPPTGSSKIKLADAANQSRVVKGRYLVETTGTPLARGGSATVNKASQTAAKTAVRSVGAKVGESFSDLWTGVSVTATDAQVKKLAQSASVKAIYPVLRVSLPRTTVSKTAIASELRTISAAGTAYTGKGIKVGVIDTGVDYNHPDLGGSGASGNNADFGPNAPRVRYGYDFVGDAYNADDDNPVVKPDPYPDDCVGHGTHVAGIIGANGTGDAGVVGVAPEVTFGAYRIFGCAEEGTTDTAMILKALTRAKADRMDVVNLSLGSDFDSWPSYPDAVAATNLVKAGVVVVASAGNSGDTGLFSAGTPAVGAGVISVAWYESEKIRTRAISVNGVNYPYTAVEATADAPADGTSHLELKQPTRSGSVDVTACGTVPLDTVGSDIALLVKRGTCAFSEKVANALAAGAGAVVIYNNAPGMDSFTAAREGQPAFTIPAISISGQDGEALATLIGTGTQTMTWMDFQKNVNNPDGGKLSAFSSAGVAADLSVVPTIAAPGGKIYSTLPDNKHGNLSGTSMASPYVAGSAAVLLQARSGLKKHPASVAQLLYNTAVPVTEANEAGVTDHAEAVFRQGSGLVNLAGALGASVTASPSVVKLGEGTRHKVTITLTNRTRQTQFYTPTAVTGVSAAASTGSGPGVGTTTPNYAFANVGFSAPKSVKVKAGRSAKVKVTITAPTSILPNRAGMLYGGWVRFTSTAGGNTVSVPFSGLRGDYQSVKLLNGFQFTTPDGDNWKLPTLASLDDDGNLVTQGASGHTYTMDPYTYDVPLVLYHLDYPASDVQLKVTNTVTHKSYDAIINWQYVKSNGKLTSSKAIHLLKQPRDNGFQYIGFEGAYARKGKGYLVPNGTYTLTLRVLKPLGKASKRSNWETFTTPSFTINRSAA